jgi:hypothetical protein
MTWTTPATAVAGSVLTASFLNTNVRDNLNYLYGSASGTAPGFAARANAVTSIPNSTETTVVFQVADQNIDSMLATSTGVATLPRTGLWLLTAQIEFASNATGNRGLHLVTSSGLGPYSWVTAAVDNAGKISAGTVLLLNSGTTVSAKAIQTSGGALNTSGGNGCIFAGRWLGG